MANPAKYTIFKTKWGYFGLVANKKGLLRTCLPCPSRHFVKRYILAAFDNPQFEKNLLKPLQDKILSYFEGRPVKFDTPLALDGLTPFTKRVLTICRQIPYGKTTTYSQLAVMIGRPNASRAVGNALAKNPIPLIIPCHRVIRSDGSPGYFSAPRRQASLTGGGTALKRKLINLEKA